MAATWPQIKAHRPLTHAVTRQQQRLRPQVSALTEQATGMKAMHLRLQTVLEQLDPTLSGTSKRMYADLAAAAALHDRTEMLEDPIQFALDHYELAIDRDRGGAPGAGARGADRHYPARRFRHAVSRRAASAAERDVPDRDPVRGPGPEGPGPARRARAFSGRSLPGRAKNLPRMSAGGQACIWNLALSACRVTRALPSTQRQEAPGRWGQYER
jgi:hypothetical protein